ncbi:type II secretion system F family protein [Microbacterium sp. P05]|uniref:type II secretion system F family protein n=1 Tax=Microbacterium sp. P05 TaxID=3366948 RepID=UPI00374668A0
MKWRRSAAVSDAALAADSVLRLSVLLRAGVAPLRAWTYLADAGDPIAERVRSVLAAGADPRAVFADAGDPWPDVGAAWRVATTVGAPLAGSLHDVAEALRDGQQAADEVRVALAEPAATARLMSWLPLVAVGLGVALGFDTLAVASNPVGMVCLALGAALIVASRQWSAALVRRAQPAPGVPGMDAELTAIALGGGVSIERARALVREARPEDAGGDVDRALALSRSAGVPAIDLLRSTAWLARHRSRTEGRLRAASLSSRLLLPLGVCTLPAFLLLGVAPMMLSIFSSGVLAI